MLIQDNEDLRVKYGVSTSLDHQFNLSLRFGLVHRERRFKAHLALLMGLVQERVFGGGARNHPARQGQVSAKLLTALAAAGMIGHY